MASTFEDFSSLDALDENVVVEDQEELKKQMRKKARKQKKEHMEELFKVSLREDPTLKERIGALSESLVVVNTLGFGDSGNIVVDAEASAKEDKRTLIAASETIGYRIQNNGKEPIKFRTEEFTRNSDGIWVGQKVDKVLAPGDVADLTRKYMTIFCAKPEISMILSNGKVMRSSAKVKAGDLDGELEAHYFAFSDSSIKVNSDAVKINVGIQRKSKKEKGGVKWVVRPEFEATFGYLNNEKPKADRPARGKGFSTQVIAANYINRLLEESGNI